MLDFRGAIHCYEIILVYFPDILLGNAQKVSLILLSSRLEDFFITDVSASYTAAIIKDISLDSNHSVKKLFQVSIINISRKRCQTKPMRTHAAVKTRER